MQLVHIKKFGANYWKARVMRSALYLKFGKDNKGNWFAAWVHAESKTTLHAVHSSSFVHVACRVIPMWLKVRRKLKRHYA